MTSVLKVGLATVLIAAIASPIGQAQPAAVQVGWCAGLARLADAKAAGFDYVELNTTEFATMSDADFEAAFTRAKEVGLPTPASNSFVPGTIRLTGPDTDQAAQMAYVTKAFDRAQRLGIQVIVFGSGGARRVPDGFSKETAFAQLVDFGKRIAPEARKRNITIAVEPLRRQESNIINTAAEGLALAEAIGDPNFQLMIDFYHLASEQESPAIVARAGARLRHLHMANPIGRVFPQRWEEFDYAPFFAALRASAYDKRISIEATPANFAEDAPRAIALVRRAFTANALPAVPGAPSQAGPAATGRATSAGPQATTPAASPAPAAAQAPRAGGPPAATAAQTPASPNPAASVGPRPNVGPADRPLVDPVMVDRGARLWAADCVTCHGASARGSDSVKSLLRSDLVLSDRGGNLLGPFLKKGHQTQSGKASASFTDREVNDLMQFLRQKINDTLRGSPVFNVQDILTGDATAGLAYFNGAGGCTACHSASGDLAGIATRISAPVDLQQRMLFPVAARGRGARGGAPIRTTVTVTITPASGAPINGVFVDEDDFYVSYRDTGGAIRSMKRTPGMKVVKQDPLQAHRELLDRITDKNIHDLVRYLETLK